MSIDAWLTWLAHATLASSVAIGVLAGSRRLLLGGFGPGAVCAAWALVPLVVLAVALPARTVAGAAQSSSMVVSTGQVVAMPAAQVDWQPWWLGAWALGALVSASRWWLRQRRFLRTLGRIERDAEGLRRAACVEGLPAAWGVLWPRIVVPADFQTRFNAVERELMLCHERSHVRRGDLQANALALLLRTVFWFNPLLHWAALRFRRDQELACDARVLALHPGRARSYAQAMLKVQAVAWPMPLGCHWRGTAPLLERIALLARPAAPRGRRLLAWLVVPGLLVAGACLSWAAQPAQVLAPASAPVALDNIPPVFPRKAIEANVNGKVVVIAEVGADGRVRQARVDSAEPVGLFEDAALKAVRSSRFAPATRDGRPVPGQARQVYYWDTGMYEVPPPKGRKDAADYAWYVIDTRSSLMKPAKGCDVVLPDPRPGVVGCGKRKGGTQ